MYHDKGRYNIAVLIGGVHTYFPQRLIEGIRDIAKEMDVNVYFFLGAHQKFFFKNMLGDDIGNTYDYQFNTIYDYSLLSGMDGVIINYGTLGTYLKDNDLVQFTRKFNSVPTVILTETIELPNCHHLISDNYQGIHMIMEHLIKEHGYRKILFVSGPDKNTDAAERKQAYLDSMEEAQLPYDSSMIACGDYSEFVDSEVEQLLDAHPDAEAIVFSNDEMALAGYRVCKARGLQVGRDIAITGYDDCTIARNMNPPLTTVCQDGFSMGRQAMVDLLAKLHHQEVSSKRIPGKLIFRGSCGCISHPVTETLEATEKSYRQLSDQLNRLQQDFLDYQRHSWFIPFLSQKLSRYVDHDEQYCYQIIASIHRMINRNMFLFLLKNPLSYNEDDTWVIPQELYLASCSRNGEIVSYAPKDRPRISSEHSMSEYMTGDTAHQYTFFLLFSGERQYGLLAMDIDSADFGFCYIISLQLGLVFRYQEARKLEAAHIEMMRQENLALDILSGFDNLTGLLNRRGFMEQMNILRPQQGSRHAYMIYGDLDHLKEINDTWGHPEGDYAIHATGQILKNALRDSDILGRIGGDEFIAFVFSDSETFADAFRKRVSAACQDLNATSDKPYYVEISLGITAFDFTANTDIQKIISRTDTLLYESKKNRRASIQKIFPVETPVNWPTYSDS